MEIGTKVGAGRWPYYGAHPDCWGRPHAGVVLAPNDPRLWKGTLAFGDRLPSQAKVDNHLAWINVNVPNRIPSVPVQWDFNGEKVVYWERVESLRPYAKDLELWMQARGAARIPIARAA